MHSLREMYLIPPKLQSVLGCGAEIAGGGGTETPKTYQRLAWKQMSNGDSVSSCTHSRPTCTPYARDAVAQFWLMG